MRTALASSLRAAVSLDDVIRCAERVLRPAVGADGGAWCTVDPVSLLWTSCRVIADLGDGPVDVPQDLGRERRIFDCEQAGEPNTIIDLYATRRVAAGLTRDVGADGLHTVRRVREVMRPLGATDEMRVLLVDRDNAWGTITFYRLFADVPFGDIEVEVAASVAPVIAVAVRRAVLRSALDRQGLPLPPGSIVVDKTGGVLDTTPAAEALLSRVDEAQVRSALVSLVTAVQRRGTARANVLGHDGAVALHGAAFKNDENLVSVVVEHPRPITLAALIVERLELTPREAEVAAWLLRGATRRQIAHGLEIGIDTVDELVGRVLGKAGTSSRAELAQLIDRRDYLPRRLASFEPGPYGFFLPEPEPGPGAEPEAQHVPAIGEGPRPVRARTVVAPQRPAEDAMESAREDLLAHAHAALRCGLFEAATALGATEWTSAAESSRAVERWQTVRRLLELHARHEDEAILPLLAGHDPLLVARVAAAHDRFTATLDDIDALVGAGLDGDTGPRLALAVRRFTVAYLAHLEEEEAEVLPALWNACSDDELRDCRARFLTIAAPGDLVEMQVLMLPAIPAPARRAVIASGRQALPAVAFQKIGMVLERRLDPAVWATVAELFPSAATAS